MRACLRVLTSLLLLSAAAQQVYAQGGRYWVNIMQSGAKSYTIRLEISAPEALEVRTLRVPSIVDASEMPGKTEIRALADSSVEFPIRFTAEGSGRLWIALQSAADARKSSFLVFDLYSAARGTVLRGTLASSTRLWQEAGNTASIMQFASSAVKCNGQLLEGADKSGLTGATRAVTGVLFIGAATELDGAVSAISARGLGLQFSLSRAGRVASFVSAGELPAEVTADSGLQQKPETKTVDPKNVSSTGDKSFVPAEEKLEIKVVEPDKPTPKSRDTQPRTEPKPKVEVPKSGPFSGSGTAANIRNLSVRRDWSPDNTSSGHFGETLVRLPPEYARLKSVSSVTLVLRIEAVNPVPASGRVYISKDRTLVPDRAGAEVWFADRYQQEGELAGEFDTEYEGPVFRYNVTSYVKSNRADGFYVSVLNLCRSPLNITDIRLEVKGER